MYLCDYCGNTLSGVWKAEQLQETLWENWPAWNKFQIGRQTCVTQPDLLAPPHNAETFSFTIKCTGMMTARFDRATKACCAQQQQQRKQTSSLTDWDLVGEKRLTASHRGQLFVSVVWHADNFLCTKKCHWFARCTGSRCLLARSRRRRGWWSVTRISVSLQWRMVETAGELCNNWTS